jgi:hypothetical protein
VDGLIQTVNRLRMKSLLLGKMQGRDILPSEFECTHGHAAKDVHAGFTPGSGGGPARLPMGRFGIVGSAILAAFVLEHRLWSGSNFRLNEPYYLGRLGPSMDRDAEAETSPNL